MKKNIGIILFCLLLTIVLVIFLNSKKRSDYKALNIDNVEIPITDNCKDIAYHSYFSLCYAEEYEQARWVGYKLTSAMIEKNAKRSNRFYEDRSIKTKSALPNDYKRSGYDRGHLCPAADMSFDKEAMQQTFYMSNMSPQTKELNRGIWKKLEESIRRWVLKDKVLYIVTGPVFSDTMSFIGNKNKIAVPYFFYKVILDVEPPEYKAIGFIIPNFGIDKSLSEYAVSIDSVEKFTNIDFFYKLPDSLEAVLEKSVNYKEWFR